MNVTLSLIERIQRLRRKWSVLNIVPGAEAKAQRLEGSKPTTRSRPRSYPSPEMSDLDPDSSTENLGTSLDRCQWYKNVLQLMKRQNVSSWQAFLDWSSICGQGQEPTQIGRIWKVHLSGWLWPYSPILHKARKNFKLQMLKLIWLSRR